MNPASTTPRSTAAERKEHLLDAAMQEFALRGYAGGSTERIAQAAGISQPYVFRLYGSKQKLFLAVLERCMVDTLEIFEHAASDLRGEAALEAIGDAYGLLINERPLHLQCQLVGYAECDDPAVRDVMRAGYGALVAFVERVSGESPDRVSAFFAKGMLLNVITAMHLAHEPTPWGDRLMEGCMHKDDAG